jgi:hypothetical protein
MTEQPGRRDGANRPSREGQRQRAPDQGAPGPDFLRDLQRWLIRSSARNMRKELGGQVRRTFGGSRAGTADVWDTATHEIPPEADEAPECQWCPICRAARAMRESGPGIGGHLTGAGDAVASAVQDAISAIDSILAKAGGNAQKPERHRPDQGPDVPPMRHRESPARPASPAGPASSAGPAGPASSAGPPGPASSAGPAGPASSAGPAGPASSAAAAPGGTEAQPGTGSGATARDPWSQATDQDSAGPGPAASAGERPDWPGHGPDDRG